MDEPYEKESDSKINLYHLSSILTGSVGSNLDPSSSIKSESDVSSTVQTASEFGCSKDEIDVKDIKILTNIKIEKEDTNFQFNNDSDVKKNPKYYNKFDECSTSIKKEELTDDETDSNSDYDGDDDDDEGGGGGDETIDIKGLIKEDDESNAEPTFNSDNRLSQTTFTCKFCKMIFHNRKKLVQHAKHHLQSFMCVPCNTKLTRKSFTKHFEKCKLGYLQPHIFTCPTCQKKFAMKQHLNNHIKSTHEETEKPWVCSLCGKHFTKRRILNFHISTHPEFWQTCGVCNRPFRKTNDLKKHLLTHQNKIPYFCLKCKLGFKEKNQFKKHKKQVHKKLNYIYKMSKA